MGPIAGGRRRIDRVLSDGFLADLPTLSAADLRFRRREAMQEETDLSYARRLIHGRLDTLRALRSGAGPAEEPAADQAGRGEPAAAGARPAASPRYMGFTPERMGETRRAEEEIVARAGLASPAELSDEDVGALIAELVAQERRISDLRSRVEHAVDELSAEMTRRLKSGEMDPLASLGE